MINVTRLNHSSVVLNCDLIEHIEATPDTVITLLNNQKITVLETPEEIVERVLDYQRSRMTAAYPVEFRHLVCDGQGKEGHGGES